MCSIAHIFKEKLVSGCIKSTLQQFCCCLLVVVVVVVRGGGGGGGDCGCGVFINVVVAVIVLVSC